MLKKFLENILVIFSILLFLISIFFVFSVNSRVDIPIEQLTEWIDKDSENAQLFIERGEAYAQRRR